MHCFDSRFPSEPGSLALTIRGVEVSFFIGVMPVLLSNQQCQSM